MWRCYTCSRFTREGVETCQRCQIRAEDERRDQEAREVHLRRIDALIASWDRTP